MEEHASTRHSWTNSSTYALDEETKAAAEVLRMLQKQQPTDGPHGARICQHPLVKQSILKVEG